jgi:hypothetical protein
MSIAGSEAVMATNVGKSPEAWRNHGIIRNPVPACHLQVGDLKKLYCIMSKWQTEYRDQVFPILTQQALVQQPTETDEQFQQRYKRVFDSFVTSVTITTTTGILITENNENVLDENSLPENIKTILISTKSVPATVLPVVSCYINVFLDFTQSPLFEFSRLPTLATVNETNYAVQADNEAWFWAANSELEQYFKGRRSNAEWIHRAGSYDALLFVFGLPVAIWLTYRASTALARFQLTSIINIAIYVYVFFLVLNGFRMLFSYVRWVFPKIELQTSGQSALKQRGILAAILLSIVGGAAYDAIKSLWS